MGTLAIVDEYLNHLELRSEIENGAQARRTVYLKWTITLLRLTGHCLWKWLADCNIISHPLSPNTVEKQRVYCFLCINDSISISCTLNYTGLIFEQKEKKRATYESSMRFRQNWTLINNWMRHDIRRLKPLFVNR